MTIAVSLCIKFVTSLKKWSIYYAGVRLVEHDPRADGMIREGRLESFSHSQ